jgi:hypothetical protein
MATWQHGNIPTTCGSWNLKYTVKNWSKIYWSVIPLADQLFTELVSYLVNWSEVVTGQVFTPEKKINGI